MPYRNKKDLSDYQRDWAWRKRHGLKTKLRAPMKDKSEIKERRKETKRAAYKRKKIFIDSHVGETCDVCGARADSIHRKDGKRHVTFYKMPWVELSETFVGDGRKYATLCKRHHKIIHNYMDKHGMNWNDAFLLLRRMRENNRRKVKTGFIAP